MDGNGSFGASTGWRGGLLKQQADSAMYISPPNQLQGNVLLILADRSGAWHSFTLTDFYRLLSRIVSRN
jgi:hypothetical protein